MTLVGVEDDFTCQDCRQCCNKDTVSFSRAEIQQIAELPREFGRYRLLKLLGRGGMGAVFLAHDTQLDRQVALKMPDFGSARGSVQTMIDRFEREARAMATVSHPHLCPIYDVGEHDGHPYLTMAFIDGPSLSDLIAKQTRFSVEESLRIVYSLALTMQAVHAAGIVHRDLKPANVIMDAKGQPFITDFGLATRDRPFETELTTQGTVVGTPAYMAPEQVQAEHHRVGPASDIHALGTILYELLTGRRAFEGKGLAAVGKISAGIRPPVPSEFADVTSQLDAICMQAIEYNPEDRFQTCEAFAAALQACLIARETAPDSASPRREQGRSWRRRIALIGFVLLLPVVFALNGDRDAARKNSQTPTDPVIADSESRRDWLWSPDDPSPAIAPFDGTQASQYQKAWAEHLHVPVEKDVALPGGCTLTLVLIPPGRFLRGSTDPERSWSLAQARDSGSHSNYAQLILGEGPQHPVVISRPFYLGKYEVTQAQWQAMMGSNPSQHRTSLDHPVEMVSWEDVQEFLGRVNDRDVSPGLTFRLPTESEWEYACRSGTSGLYHWSGAESLLTEYAWTRANSSEVPHEVGQLSPNAFGLFDMYGNVSEWCADIYGSIYKQLESRQMPLIDPTGSTKGSTRGTHRVTRGGNCTDAAVFCRSAWRYGVVQETRIPFRGFRLSATIRSDHPPKESH